MTATVIPFLPFLLVLLTACGYAFATVGMKLSADTNWYAGIIVIVLGLTGAALAEIALLRLSNLSLVYLGIIIGETILVLSYAAYVQEGLSLKQMGGASLVIMGFALVCIHD